MMLGLIDHLIHSFSIARLIIVSLIARLITLFLLPSTPSFLAPDEGNYATLALWVAESRDIEEYPAFGPGLYNTSKSLILPASWLIRFGINELTSVRLVSIFFGVLSVFIFAKIVLLLLGAKELAEISEIRIQRTAVIGILVFAFLPSNFIWSTLGLREAASKAMILCTFFLLLKLKSLDSQIRSLKTLVILSLLAIGAIALSFGARRQTAIVFVIFFCSLFLLGSLRRNFIPISAVILLGTSFGLLFSTTPVTTASTQFVWSPSASPGPVASETKSPGPVASETKSPGPVASETKSPGPVASETKSPGPVASETKSPGPVASETKSPGPVASETKSPGPVASETKSPGPVASEPSASELCEREGQVISTDSGDRVCESQVVKVKKLSPAQVIEQAPISTVDELAIKRNVNREGAQTALPETSCLNVSLTSFSKAQCALKELPYRLVSFLFRPFLGLDSGSLANNLASIENVGWLILVFTFLLQVASSLRHKIHLDVVVPTSAFVIAFSSLAALYEGNLGTAFRHKSTILWCLVLVTILVFSTQWQKSQKEVTQN